MNSRDWIVIASYVAVLLGACAVLKGPEFFAAIRRRRAKVLKSWDRFGIRLRVVQLGRKMQAQYEDGPDLWDTAERPTIWIDVRPCFGAGEEGANRFAEHVEACRQERNGAAE